MLRSMRRFVRVAVLVAAAFASSVAVTEACTCLRIDPAAACEMYREVDVAFVGRAMLVPSGGGDGPVRFQLTQTLKGVVGSDVTVLNRGCGVRFEPGEDYIVFAARHADGSIVIPMCWTAIWLAVPDLVPDFVDPVFRRETAEAVAFVESLRKPAIGGRIFGDVRTRVPFNASATRPVNGATVILRGSGRERRATTVDGRYQFTALPRGTYTVSVTMPDGLTPARSARPPEHLLSQSPFRFDYRREYTRRIAINDARSCGYAPFEPGENPDRGR